MGKGRGFTKNGKMLPGVKGRWQVHGSSVDHFLYFYMFERSHDKMFLKGQFPYFPKENHHLYCSLVTSFQKKSQNWHHPSSLWYLVCVLYTGLWAGIFFPVFSLIISQKHFQTPHPSHFYSLSGSGINYSNNSKVSHPGPPAVYEMPR